MAERLCSRCGVVVRGTAGTYAYHRKMCDALPPPEELANAFIDSGLLMKEFFRTVNGSQPSVQKRVDLGLEILRDKDLERVRRWEAWYKKAQRDRRSKHLKKLEQIRRDRAGGFSNGRYCRRCELDLKSKLVRAAGKPFKGFCPFCAEELAAAAVRSGRVRAEVVAAMGAGD